MRVIARDKCFIDGVLYRAGAEFDYEGPLDKNGALPKFLVPADVEARKQLGDVKKLQERKDLEAAKAAAGPKRQGDAAFKVQGNDLL